MGPIIEKVTLLFVYTSTKVADLLYIILHILWITGSFGGNGTFPIGGLPKSDYFTGLFGKRIDSF